MRSPQLALPVLAEPAVGQELAQRGSVVRFLAWEARSVLNPPASTGMAFWSVNPYVGCEFGCSYCYARDTHRWARARARGGERTDGLDPDIAFEQEVLVKLKAPELLAGALRQAVVGKTPLVIGTATDPYQPAERQFRLTRRLLETLLKWEGLHLGIITKSPLIVRDLDLLAALHARHRLTVLISLASTEQRLIRRLERRSPGPRARLRALRTLSAAGLHTKLLIAPVLPGITDGTRSLDALMAAAREAGARDANGDVLRLGAASRRSFLPLLGREFPELAARYERAYARGRQAPEAYRAALRRRIDLLRRRHGFPMEP